MISFDLFDENRNECLSFTEIYQIIEAIHYNNVKDNHFVINLKKDLEGIYEKNKVKTMERSEFFKFVKAHHVLYLPIIQQQEPLKKKFFGLPRWEILTEYREKHFLYTDYNIFQNC
jgi:hypothetical protein